MSERDAGEPDTGERDAFHPAYFATHFRVAAPMPAWPPAFVIVTAYATTGEQWTDEENRQANAALLRLIERRGVWHHEITGYDPHTGHAEPGWAMALSVEDGAALGREFRQDAIYVVQHDALRVVSCHKPAQAAVGSFRGRIVAVER